MSSEIPGTVAEIRAQRNALQGEEDAISYVRRLAQGRLDLVQDEERRRASGNEAPVGSLAERLADVFGQQHGGGSARPPRETNVPDDHPLVKELDEMCDHYQFESLENLDDRGLSDLAGALGMFEKSCSQQRHELFERIDALTAALVAQVRASGAGSVVKDQ
ncbi:unannotated protein [freshwater metagenome]|jgi:hypothetical protein|uniref:Unannotated protein n=1 Tax=freshwater metagenome TaxID=449393 RepID=A0A6J6G5G8_9ZZZZ|nr:hypothetical protein [Actinomycetota bacterium]